MALNGIPETLVSVESSLQTTLKWFIDQKNTLACVAQWIESQPANQRVTSSISSQGTCLGLRSPTRGTREATTH